MTQVERGKSNLECLKETPRRKRELAELQRWESLQRPGTLRRLKRPDLQEIWTSEEILTPSEWYLDHFRCIFLSSPASLFRGAPPLSHDVYFRLMSFSETNFILPTLGFLSIKLELWHLSIEKLQSHEREKQDQGASTIDTESWDEVEEIEARVLVARNAGDTLIPAEWELFHYFIHSFQLYISSLSQLSLPYFHAHILGGSPTAGSCWVRPVQRNEEGAYPVFKLRTGMSTTSFLQPSPSIEVETPHLLLAAPVQIVQVERKSPVPEWIFPL